RDQFRHAQVHELAEAGAADDGLAYLCDDGDAHPEGIEAGGVAVVGKCIETDIDAMVMFEIIAAFDPEGELKAVCGGARGFHGLRNSPTRAAFSREQDKARIGNGTHDLRPELQAALVDLARIIQTAKGDVAVANARKPGDRLRDERIVAPERVGESDGGL